MNQKAEIGVIGGSGFYSLLNVEHAQEVRLETPFGDPSDAYVIGEIAGRRVAFLARHGRGHKLSPSELNFRANIYGMKMLGVERILSLSAVGSMKEEHAPLDFVIPDQFFDRTRGRISTFFTDGVVAHISFADPVCPQVAAVAHAAARESDINSKLGGTYLCMEGPAFSTRAESNVYRGWGMDVIGMTNLQEAKLAREAEICYATVAMVTDYDCWKVEEEPVSAQTVFEHLVANAETAKRILAAAIPKIPQLADWPEHFALETALTTERKLWPKATLKRLMPILKRFA